MHTLPIKYPSDEFFGRIRPRGLFVLTLVILATVVLYWELTHARPIEEEVSQAQLFGWIKEGHVTQLVNEPDAATGIRYLTGVYHQDKIGAPDTVINFKVPVDLQLSPYLMSEIRQAGYTGAIETVNNTNVAVPLFLNFVPLILFLIIVCLAVRAIVRWASRLVK